MIIKTISGGLAGRRSDTKAAQHSTGTLLLAGAELELSTSQGGFTSEAWQTETPGHVIESSAVSVLTTHVGQTADIDTLVTNTGSL